MTVSFLQQFITSRSPGVQIHLHAHEGLKDGGKRQCPRKSNCDHCPEAAAFRDILDTMFSPFRDIMLGVMVYEVVKMPLRFARLAERSNDRVIKGVALVFAGLGTAYGMWECFSLVRERMNPNTEVVDFCITCDESND
jgi:hypothetical protein